MNRIKTNYQKPVMRFYNIKTRSYFLAGSGGNNPTSVRSSVFKSDITGADGSVACRARSIACFDDEEE